MNYEAENVQVTNPNSQASDTTILPIEFRGFKKIAG